MKFVNTSWFREGTKHFQPEWLVAPLHVHWKEISFISSHSINKIREDCDITSCQPSSFHCFISLRRSVSQRSWMHEEAYHKIRMQKRYLTNTPQKKSTNNKKYFLWSKVHHTYTMKSSISMERALLSLNFDPWRMLSIFLAMLKSCCTSW